MKIHLVRAVAWAFALLATSSFASAAIVEHTFNVGNLTINRLCQNQVITAVNGKFPGPTIHVREGDTVVVHVLNNSPYNLTVHWHGIFQILSGWADGPEYVTQCPIRPKHSYTYRFKITGQEGTLWWHAHSSFLRATVHGALLISPRKGQRHPFPKPYKEVPVLIGEWWKTNVMDFNPQSFPHSDTFLINGLPGALSNCSNDRIFKLRVKPKKTYLLRIINTNMEQQMFFKVANHNLTVVGIDATYTTPYFTDVIVTGPGQTVNALLKADQAVGSYYMGASIFFTPNATFDNTTATALIVYQGSESRTPLLPIMPVHNDTDTAFKFYSNLTGLVDGPHWRPCPEKVDERLFFTFGFGLEPCPKNTTCLGPLGNQFSSSMNNQSFVLPRDKNLSMLEAFYSGASGVYTRDFPSKPPLEFDYTNPNNAFNTSLIFAPKTTTVKTLKFNTTVEIVLQDTAFLSLENHPIHIHGFDFHVLAQGFGNFNYTRDGKKFNLVNPQVRNTIGVPKGGWVVIRFQANNPGIWFVHCHIDSHMLWGMGMTFEVENGPTPESTLPPPPPDLPKC